MSQTLAFALVMAGTVILAAILVAQSARDVAERKRDDSQQPSTQWRRHLQKPSHLAFRQTRFDRHPGNFRRIQRS